MNMICIHCAREMRAFKIGVILARGEHDWRFADLYECPGCHIVVADPAGGHWQYDPTGAMPKKAHRNLGFDY